MKKDRRKFAILSLLFLVFLGFSAQSMAVDANIQNHTGKAVTIEYRIVGVGGRVEWRDLGTINTRSAKIFPRLSIGSVLRAKDGSRVLGQYRVTNPAPGQNQVVFFVR